MSGDDLTVWIAVAKWLGDLGIDLSVKQGVELQEALFRPPPLMRIPVRKIPWLMPTGLIGGRLKLAPIVAFRISELRRRFEGRAQPGIDELIAIAGCLPGKVRTMRVVRSSR